MKKSKMLCIITALFFLCLAASPLYAVEKQFRTQLNNNAIGSMCLSTSTDSATPGANVVLGICDLNRARWDVTAVDGDKYRVKSIATGLCLAAATPGANSGNFIQALCTSDDTALWRFALVSEMSLGNNYPTIPAGIVTKVSIANVPTEVDGGFYELHNVSSFSCADVSGGIQAVGTQVVPFRCSRGFNQHWFVGKGVPDTAETIEFNLLVVNKSVSIVPGHEKSATPESKLRQRYWTETVMSKYFHDYTNGRVKINMHYYESPYPTTRLSGNSDTVSPMDILEDADIMFNPGWYDLILINHFTSNLPTAGLVTYGISRGNLTIGVSNTPLGDDTAWFNGNKIEQLAGMVHELMHQFEQYWEKIPSRNKATPACIGGSFLDCGSNTVEGGNYVESTDGLGGNLALYRDFLNGYVFESTGGIGEPMWDSGFKMRDRSTHFVPGGPLSPFANQSTCLNLTASAGEIAKDLNKNNNFATVYNANRNNNWTGSGFLFDGVDDYLRIGNLVGDDFTISTWIKSSQIFAASGSASSGVGLVYAGSDEGNGFELRGVRLASGNDAISFKAGAFSAVVADRDITTNAWVHIAVSRNKATGIATLYVNGTQVASGNTGTARLNKNPVVRIGSAFPFRNTVANPSLNDRFKGEMADFCLMNSALSAASIAQLASARKTFVNSPIGPQTDLAGNFEPNPTNFNGDVQINRNTVLTPILIGGTTYAKGLGTHAPSEITYKLNGNAAHFLSVIGIDDNANCNGDVTSAGFEVYGDGNLLYGADRTSSDAPLSIDVDVRGVQELRLVTNVGKDAGVRCDQTDWANARLSFPQSSTSSSRASSSVVRSSSRASSSVAAGPIVTIQAEAFSNMSGVQTEATSDIGGGLNVGWIDANDWLSYSNTNVTIPSTGTYTVEYRVASLNGTGRLRFEEAGGAIVYGFVNIGATGGWQNWVTIKHTVTLSAGVHKFGISATGGGWNFNWFRITPGVI